MSSATRVLFLTPQYLIDNTVINGNVEQKILNKCIRTAEDKYIMPLIGSPLYESLITKITGNTLTGVYKTLMDDYVIPCLLEYSLYEYIPFTSFKFRNKGVSKQTSPESEPADLADLSYLRENVKDSAQFYGDRLVKHLKANNSQTFPEYYQLRTIEDVPPARSDYFSGIQFPGQNRGNGFDGLGLTYNINF
jgi:hypothetical protein